MATKKKKSSAPTTSRARLASVIKSARDTMRKDAGLNGDLDRLPQLSWLLFLKTFDERVEKEGPALRSDYRLAIEEPYRWQDWATNPDFSGPELKKFIDEKLIPYLAGLKDADGDADDPRNILSTIFRDVSNRMQSGTLLRDLVNLVDQIHFDSTDDLHTMAYVYESILKEMRDAAGDSGEFYTPRPVNRFMVQQSFLKLGESILDPACGTGGFLVQSYEELKPLVQTDTQRKKLHANIRGIEKKPLPYLLACMNLLLHGISAPRVVRANALLQMRDATAADRVDVVLTNPPFGGEEERSVVAKFPSGYQTQETSWLFLHAIMDQLKKGGRCAIVLPNSSLIATSENSAGSRIKEKLLKECDLHTIVRLPPGVFTPYTQIPSNILFFEKGKPTTGVWYYEVQVPKGRRGYSKTMPMQLEEFDACVNWWGGKRREDRLQTPSAWKVHAINIKESGYNLHIHNPHNGEDLEHRSPAVLLAELIKMQTETLDVLEQLSRELKEIDTSAQGKSLKWRPLRDGIALDLDEVAVSQDSTYPMAGVYGFGRGIIERSTISGSDTKYSHLNRLHAGTLVMSRLKAFEGALTVVPESSDGRYVSPEFPTFFVNTGVISPEYLGYLCRWPKLWSLLSKESKGIGARRERVSAERLLATKVPLPDIDTQLHITAVLGRARAALQLQEEKTSLTETLHLSILNAAFSGQL